MGKGDKKTKRGKITAGSYGVRRQSKFMKRKAAVQANAPQSTAKEKTN